MAKSSADTAIGPNSYSVGLGIFSSGVQTAVEGLNYFARQNVTTFFSFQCDDVDATNPLLLPHEIVFRTDATPVDRFQGRIWIDPDIQVITCGAGTEQVANQTVTLTFTIGSSSCVVTIASGGSGGSFSSTNTVATSATGTGAQDFTVTLTHTVGGGLVNLDFIRCEGTRILAADLADPVP